MTEDGGSPRPKVMCHCARNYCSRSRCTSSHSGPLVHGAQSGEGERLRAADQALERLVELVNDQPIRLQPVPTVEGQLEELVLTQQELLFQQERPAQHCSAWLLPVLSNALPSSGEDDPTDWACSGGKELSARPRCGHLPLASCLEEDAALGAHRAGSAITGAPRSHRGS